MDAGKHEPMPVKNDHVSIQDRVLQDLSGPLYNIEPFQQLRADIERRKEVGLERYGTLLQPFNGRDALMDLYQELLDAIVYARQVVTEGDTSMQQTYQWLIQHAGMLRQRLTARDLRK